MAAIKKFFQKRKLDVKFKRAGEGHSLGETSAPKSTRSPEAVPGPARTRGPGTEAMRAAEAALARQTSQDKQGKAQIQKKRASLHRSNMKLRIFSYPSVLTFL